MIEDYTVFDIESDGLLDTITKIHVLSYQIYKKNALVAKGSITDYNQMIRFLRVQKVLVGHNIIRYDLPAIKKILGIDVTCTKVDTLALSWYLYPMELKKGILQSRKEHGLEAWGEILGFKKPKVDDWQNLSIEEYTHRCESDVEINTRLWHQMKEYLFKIYGDLGYKRLIGYLTFKLDCAREQEEEFCHINKVQCNLYLSQIIEQINEKVEEIADAMPENIKYKTLNKPKVYFKQDGSLSAHGERWKNLCEERQLNPEDTLELKVEAMRERGNPNSHIQLKEWLFSLGWEPTMYEERTSSVTGITKEVPQISKEGKICSNIKAMFEEYPVLKNLEGLTILSHRKGVFEGFLKALDSEDRVQAKIDGLTNTLRFQHRKPIANLTKVGKPWGKEIRSLITVPNDTYTLCGSDMSALEDTTKQHYMYYFDPEYVMAMRVPGFDPHIDIAIFANLMTKEQGDKFKEYKHRVEDLKEHLNEQESKEFFTLNKARSNAKTVNFAGVYGAGPPKIAKTLKCSLEFAQKLHTAYWERNKAVKLVAKTTFYKTVDGQMWLFNPVSGLYYSLRYEKDIFSTLNQGTGVYCFDSWLRKVRAKNIKITLQYHDEIGFKLLKGEEEQREKDLKDAIEEVNQEIKLNVPLGISVAFGPDYSAIH